MTPITENKVCPNEADILAYAAKIGVKNASIAYDGIFGFSLNGEGRAKKCGGTTAWPLIWQVAQECGMAHGGGGAKSIQIRPDKFKLPELTKVPASVMEPSTTATSSAVAKNRGNGKVKNG
jgi:hypothetical protein